MDYKKIIDSTKFYNGKQEDYSKYRPSYPKELFEFLVKDFNLRNKDIVELGAGTGKFSKIVSTYCNKIYYERYGKKKIVYNININYFGFDSSWL